MKTEQKHHIRHQKRRKNQQQQNTTTNLFRRRIRHFLNNGSDEAIIHDFHCQLQLLPRIACIETTSSESELSTPASEPSALIIIIEVKKICGQIQSRIREQSYSVQSYSARLPTLRGASTYCLRRITRDNSTILPVLNDLRKFKICTVIFVFIPYKVKIENRK